MNHSFRVFDLHRIFLGDTPPLFLLEIVFRTLIMYTYTVFLLRLLGKRGMGQLSMLELAIIIAFGSAVGDPMVGAEAPMLHGMVSITVVTLFQIGLERMINKNPKVEAVVEGKPNLIVENGVINWDCMKRDNISKADLFRSLRTKDVEHLGQVQRAFFEISGAVSVFFQPPKKIKPGLPLLPDELINPECILEQPGCATKTCTYSCINCGHTQEMKKEDPVPECELCGQHRWVEAAI